MFVVFWKKLSESFSALGKILHFLSKPWFPSNWRFPKSWGYPEIIQSLSDWWFGTFFIFPFSWE